jgi:hypothetical protein
MQFQILLPDGLQEGDSIIIFTGGEAYNECLFEYNGLERSIPVNTWRVSAFYAPYTPELRTAKFRYEISSPGDIGSTAEIYLTIRKNTYSVIAHDTEPVWSGTINEHIGLEFELSQLDVNYDYEVRAVGARYAKFTLLYDSTTHDYELIGDDPVIQVTTTDKTSGRLYFTVTEPDWGKSVQLYLRKIPKIQPVDIVPGTTEQPSWVGNTDHTRVQVLLATIDPTYDYEIYVERGTIYGVRDLSFTYNGSTFNTYSTNPTGTVGYLAVHTLPNVSNLQIKVQPHPAYWGGDIKLFLVPIAKHEPVPIEANDGVTPAWTGLLANFTGKVLTVELEANTTYGFRYV